MGCNLKGDMMFNIFKNRINNNNIKVNEEKLLKKYGNCRTLPNHIKLLVITDTHDFLQYEEYQEKLHDLGEYDLCCALGDISYRDYEIILRYVPKEKIVALLGNHDDFEVLNHFGLNDLNGKIITINGIRIGGIQGSYRYKTKNFPSFTHEESIKFLNQMDEVDILLSHDGPFQNYSNSNLVHIGLKGITEYLYKNRVPYNIHGHNHVSQDSCLKNGTKVLNRYFIEEVIL